MFLERIKFKENFYFVIQIKKVEMVYIAIMYVDGGF